MLLRPGGELRGRPPGGRACHGGRHEGEVPGLRVQRAGGRRLRAVRERGTHCSRLKGEARHDATSGVSPVGAPRAIGVHCSELPFPVHASRAHPPVGIHAVRLLYRKVVVAVLPLEQSERLVLEAVRALLVCIEVRERQSIDLEHARNEHLLPRLLQHMAVIWLLPLLNLDYARRRISQARPQCAEESALQIRAQRCCSPAS